ncbi:AMP-binding protein, partial [Polymorphobacter multimanifer]
AQAPEALALAAGAVRLNYRCYAAAVASLAAQLVAAGARGRAVVLLLRNGVELPIGIFGAQAAGGQACALNPDYTERELAEMLAVARTAVAITHVDLAERLRAALGAEFHGTLLVLPDDAAAWVASLQGVAPALPAPDPDSIATLQFTGGTAGVPKAVMLSHRAIAANVAQREAVLPTLWQDERVICMMPLFHSFAAAMGLHLAANCAGSLHILPRYRPDWVVETIAAERITRLPAGPTVFNSLLAYDGLAGADLASLRSAWSGSAPLSAETLRRWQAQTGVPVLEGYGQSEAGPILTYHGPGMVQKLGSVGPAVPGTEVQIVDVETGVRVLGPGDLGEVRVRGPQIMAGYLDDAAATAEALRDGWLHTGDIGRLD